LVLCRDGASVFCIKDDNTAEKIIVEVGIAAGEFIEVKGNLQPGDRVVVRGGERLRPGQAVQILGTGEKS
jgi:multidrug efflux pump subunit AcrA (membrane-fusion protein)